MTDRQPLPSTTFPLPFRLTPATSVRRQPTRKRVAAPVVPRPPSLWSDPHRGMSEADVARLTPEQVTEYLDDRARCLLKSPHLRTPRPLGFAGAELRHNEFVNSLLADVPALMYEPTQVYSVSINGKYDFASWLWTFCGVNSLNQYVAYYNKVNCDAPFPKEEFLAQRRCIKNRAYQRRSRAKILAQT